MAISGNTATGKSSLLREVELRLPDSGPPTVYIDERQLHPPLVSRMFARPADFALPVQLGFLVNRHLVLKRNLLELDRVVFIERSHLDDELFMRDHATSGYVSTEEFCAYQAIAATLHRTIPEPDVLVLLGASAETSLRRLATAEALGERPREFPDEDTKATYVRRWHQLYEDLHSAYRAAAAARPGWMSIVEVPETMPLGVAAQAVIEGVRRSVASRT